MAGLRNMRERETAQRGAGQEGKTPSRRYGAAKFVAASGVLLLGIGLGADEACELIAHSFHHIHGLPATGLRFFTAYGPRNRPDLAIHKFADLIERGRPIPMFGDGTTRRDYTYVGDIVDGVARALDRCSSYHIYNLGHSEPIALRDMIAAVGRALGKEPVVDRQPEQPGDVRQTYADISRARSELGYDPSTPFDEGLARFVSWFRSR